MHTLLAHKYKILGLGILFLAVFVFAWSPLSFFKTAPMPGREVTHTNKDGKVWGPLPQGLYSFNVASADESIVKFGKGEINPPDVHVGDVQKFKIEVSSPNGIQMVTAHIQTDVGTTTVPLAPTSQNEWIGEWVVKDTHDTRYVTEFVAVDAKGNSDKIDIAWSDLCGIGLSGNWSMQTNNGGASCTVSGIDGVDNGNVAIDAGTLTINGTFAWNAGKSITISGTGKIIIGAGGTIKQSNIYMMDADSDGKPATATQYLTQVAGSQRKSVMTTTTVDCNDASSSVWQYLTGYPDNDGDGRTSPSSSSVCAGASLPVLNQTSGNDCNDSNASVWQTLYGYTDADGDGYRSASQDSVCSGASLPSGWYTSAGSDCDDYNYNVNSYITAYYDGDGDGFGSWSTSLCASSPYYPYVSNGGDCNDSNNAVHAYQTFYTDADGDGYGRPFYYDANYNRITETGTSLCAASAPAGYSANKSDCNDTSSGVNVGNCLSGSFSGGSGVQGGTISGQFTHIRYDLTGDPVTYPTLTSSISGLPSGTTCSNYPNCGPSNYYVAMGGNAVHPVTFNIPAGTPIGTYNVSITISSANVGFTGMSESHTYSTTLSVTSSCTSGYQDNDGDGYGAGSYGCYNGSVAQNNNDCDDNYYGRWIGTQRSMYQAQAKSCGTACASETQTCQSGGTWSGTYTASSCSVSTRTMYTALTSACGTYGSQGESQSCQTSGSWSGTYTLSSPPFATTRTMYQSAGACGGTCTSETQTCQSSGSWSGSYSYSTCSTAGTTYYRDSDGDGYGSPSVTTNACSQPAGYVTNSSDCYDSDSRARPGGVWQSFSRGDGSWDWNCDGVEQHKWCGQNYAIGNAWQYYTNAPYYSLGSSCTYSGTVSGYYTPTYALTDLCGIACGQATGQSCASTYMYLNSSCSAGSGGQYYSQGGISQQDCQ